MADFAYLSEDGTVCYRLSGFGRCIREVVAARLGKQAVPLDDDAVTRLSQGELHEKDVIERLVADGTPIHSPQVEVRLELGGAIVIGHLDGVAGKPPDSHCFETKGLASNEFKRVERLGIVEWLQEKKQQAYLWQISGAMLATKLPALYAIKNKESGKIITAVMDSPFRTLDDFKHRHQTIQSYVERGEFPDCEKTGWCWNGPYRQFHFKKDEHEATIDTRNEFLDELLSDLKDVRSQMKALKDKEDWLKDTILQGWGVGKIRTDRFLITITNHVQKRLNTRRLKDQIGEDEYDDLCDEVSYTKLGPIKEIPRGESEIVG